MIIKDRLRPYGLAALIGAAGLLAGCSVSDDGMMGFSDDTTLAAQTSTDVAAGPAIAADTEADDTVAEAAEAPIETAAESNPDEPTNTEIADGAGATDAANTEDVTTAEAPPAAATDEPQDAPAALAVVEEKEAEAASPFARLFSRPSAAPARTRPIVDMSDRQTEATSPAAPTSAETPAAAAPQDEAPAEAELAAPQQPPAPEVSETTTTASVRAPQTERNRVASSGPLLPGVRDARSLYQLPTRDGFDYTSYDDDNGTVQLASAAGLAGLAGKRLAVQHDKVDVACLKPRLVQQLNQIERHFGRPVLVTSGYRNRKYNRQVGGARESKHMYCEAADIQVPGVTKWQIAEYVRSLPGRGGVGTYCHTESVHVDIGSKRDWNWRCRRKK